MTSLFKNNMILSRKSKRNNKGKSAVQGENNYKMMAFVVAAVLILSAAIPGICYCVKHKNSIETFFAGKKSPDYYKYGSPLKNIVDDRNRILNVCFIIYPFTDTEKHKTYLKAMRKGMYFIGMSSYINFPCKTQNKHCITYKDDNISWTHNYFDLVSGWCHCYRDPNTCIPYPFPKRLISESDFVRHEGYKYDSNIKDADKEYDFIYICLKDNDKCDDGWQSEGRNWAVAKKCIDIMCEKYKMKGLLIGRVNCELPKSCHTQKLVDTTDFLKYHEFMKQYQRCKFIFVPNILDASPRVLAEGLAHNLPCLVNYNIVGGWKYVNDKTGEFFTNETDFEKSLIKLRKNMEKQQYQPRDYFINNHGPKHEGKELINFIKEIIPNYKKKLNYDIDEIEYLRPVV